MSLRTRLALGIAAIAAVLVLPLIVALRSLEEQHDAMTLLREGDFAASLLLGRFRSTIEDLRRAETALLFVHDEASRETMAAHVGTLEALADSLDRYQLDTAAVEVRRAVEEITTFAPREYTAALEGRAATADSISVRHVVPAIARAEQWIGAAERSLSRRTRDRVIAVSEAVSASRELAAVALTLAAILAAAIGIWLTRSISRPVETLDRGMRAVADGEFDYRLPLDPTRADEFGRLRESFDSMASQLQELDRLKAEFVSVASHELKTPINVILGYLQLMQENIYGDLTPKQREVCQTLEGQARSLGRLVQQLLDLSRFEAGSGQISPRPMALGRFLEELERTFQVLAHQRGVAFRVLQTDNVPAEVSWDADRIGEVVANLLSNAFKFTDRGGEVTLSVSDGGGMVLLEVRDTGAGIPSEELPHVFEKFYQADNQRRAAHLGTGLGLAISREIVEAHHGTIRCESTVGVGTRFLIELPIDTACAVPVVAAPDVEHVGA